MSTIKKDYSDQIFSDYLRKLDISQPSILSASGWALAHTQHSKSIIRVWSEYFSEAPKSQYVSLLFLANDIIQNSYRRGYEFCQDFVPEIISAIRLVVRGGDEEALRSTEHMLEVWIDRNIYDDDVLNRFWEVILESDDPEDDPVLREVVDGIIGDHGDRIGLEGSVADLVRRLEDLEKCPSNDPKVIEKAKSTEFELRREDVLKVLDSNGLEKTRKLFRDSKSIVDRYTNLLADELRQRRSVSRDLHALINQHKLLLVKEKKRSDEVRRQLKTLEDSKQKLENQMKTVARHEGAGATNQEFPAKRPRTNDGYKR